MSVWFCLSMSLQTSARGGGPSLRSHSCHGVCPASREEKGCCSTLTKIITLCWDACAAVTQRDQFLFTCLTACFSSLWSFSLFNMFWCGGAKHREVTLLLFQQREIDIIHKSFHVGLQPPFPSLWSGVVFICKATELFIFLTKHTLLKGDLIYLWAVLLFTCTPHESRRLYSF